MKNHFTIFLFFLCINVSLVSSDRHPETTLNTLLAKYRMIVLFLFEDGSSLVKLHTPGTGTLDRGVFQYYHKCGFQLVMIL